MSEPLHDRTAYADSWWPAPRYLLRRNLVLSLLRKRASRGSLVEIGSATGDILHHAAALGYSCTGVERSPEACGYLRARFEQDPRVTITDEDFRNLRGTYDTLLAFEVLEHIENDVEALASWHSLINRDGWLLLSVPGDMNYWSIADEVGGHYRRYEVTELEDKLRQAGFRQAEVMTYGKPIVSLLEVLLRRHWRKAGAAVVEQEDVDERTSNSGIRRNLSPLQRALCNDYAFLPFFALQRAFLRTRKGSALLAVARK
jgi:SAM-dependent methyltransferase